MKKRDLLFYLAVFVALSTSAATAANIQTIADLRGEINEQAAQIAELTEQVEAVSDERDDLRDELWRILEVWEQGNRDDVEIEDESAYEQPAWMQAGEFRIYHYCPCELCCGKHPGEVGYGITATGTVATAGRTIAVDPSVIPLGSEVLINGVIYIAEDTGVKGKTIDLFVDSHEQALSMGTYTTFISWR
ncbi:MAG: hypothetical protein J6M06_01040 [Synergistaceae bacterium]|nr:hypothetical protein [Synergistaceae bacterium]